MSFNRLSKKLGFSMQSEVSQPQVAWGKPDSWCNQDTHSNFSNKLFQLVNKFSCNI